MTGKSTAAAKAASASLKIQASTDPFAGQTAIEGAAAPFAAPLTQTIGLSSGEVLTVGSGMEFGTLEAALKASVNGDTILVKAGTYVNDFCTVNTNVTVLAMGGMVNEVATVPPPNGKGIFVTNADLTLRGFSFTGGSDGSPDGNVSAIRDQAGNLTMSYCNIHDMQEGILVTPNVAGTGTVTIDHTEIYNCGTGDGYSHDIYVGDVASFTLRDSYIHNANVGHEVKSRAAVTNIVNNTIADGQTGTASYDIDIPNAGAARIVGNIIQKGAHASNAYAIHYGGETQYAWATNSLLVSGNTIINNYGPNAYAVLNQSYVNGLSVQARLVGNSFYGFNAQNILLGLGHISGMTLLSADPGFSTASPWTSLPNITLRAGTERLNLVTQGNLVTGNANLLVMNDSAGNNQIVGGTGGLQLNETQGWNSISTHSGAIDSLVLDGRKQHGDQRRARQHHRQRVV